jgi:hypothetical protein
MGVAKTKSQYQKLICDIISRTSNQENQLLKQTQLKSHKTKQS